MYSWKSSGTSEEVVDTPARCTLTLHISHTSSYLVKHVSSFKPKLQFYFKYLTLKVNFSTKDGHAGWWTPSHVYIVYKTTLYHHWTIRFYIIYKLNDNNMWRSLFFSMVIKVYDRFSLITIRENYNPTRAGRYYKLLIFIDITEHISVISIWQSLYVIM